MSTRRTMPVQPLRACPGCLGSQRCWTCSGQGHLATRNGDRVVCTSCAGQRHCTVCAPVRRRPYALA